MTSGRSSRVVEGSEDNGGPTPAHDVRG
jgi:hypothetical protein